MRINIIKNAKEISKNKYTKDSKICLTKEKTKAKKGQNFN